MQVPPLLVADLSKKWMGREGAVMVLESLEGFGESLGADVVADIG